MAAEDSFGALQQSAVARCEIELAARSDVVKMTIDLWGKRVALGYIILDQSAVLAVLVTIAYGGGGYIGNQIGLRVAVYLANRHNHPVYHKLLNPVASC
jgi:hypothetical protein